MRNRNEQRLARALQRAEGIPYQTALQRVRAERARLRSEREAAEAAGLDAALSVEEEIELDEERWRDGPW